MTLNGQNGLGCALSTQVGTDCDSFWYYTWPPCWSNSRSDWETICGSVDPTQGGGSDITCGVGGCGQDTILGIPVPSTQQFLMLAAVGLGAYILLTRGKR